MSFYFSVFLEREKEGMELGGEDLGDEGKLCSEYSVWKQLYFQYENEILLLQHQQQQKSVD